MNPDPLFEFRRLVSHRARHFQKQWEASKKLIERATLPLTLSRLHHALLDKDLPASVKEPCSVYSNGRRLDVSKIWTERA